MQTLDDVDFGGDDLDYVGGIMVKRSENASQDQSACDPMSQSPDFLGLAPLSRSLAARLTLLVAISL